MKVSNKRLLHPPHQTPLKHLEAIEIHFAIATGSVPTTVTLYLLMSCK